jgi:hypothetical protein
MRKIFLFAFMVTMFSCSTKKTEKVDTLAVSDSTEIKLIEPNWDKWKTLSEDSATSEFGFLPPKKKIESALIAEFESIDPIEYYLSKKEKFEDGKTLHKKKKRLSKMIDKYRDYQYQFGHVEEKKNNMTILRSLIVAKYPDEVISLMESEYDHNKNIVQLKAGTLVPGCKPSA